MGTLTLGGLAEPGWCGRAQPHATLFAVAAGLALATRGRLGLPSPTPATDQDQAAGS